MANITAADVMALRNRTGLPMMDCKQALAESGGDPDKAIEILRKRGAAAAERKAGRETAEGRIGLFVSADAKAGALVEVRCETAQVAGNEVFRRVADALARQVTLASEPIRTVEQLLDQNAADELSRTVRDILNDAINKTRENILVQRFVRLDAERIGAYAHFNGQIAVMVAARPAEASADVLSDACMQIAAMRPMAVTREQVPAELVEKERQIARAQVEGLKKPPQIIDRIVDGKMNKWFGENVLVEQAFVKDPTGKTLVRDVLKTNGDIRIESFVRMAVGEVGPGA